MLHILLWISASLLVAALFWIGGAAAVRSHLAHADRLGKPGAVPLIGQALEIAGRNARLLVGFGLIVAAPSGVVWLACHYDAPIVAVLRASHATAGAVSWNWEHLSDLMEWRLLEAASEAVHIWIGLAFILALRAADRGGPVTDDPTLAKTPVTDEIRKRWSPTLLFSVVVAAGPFGFDLLADLVPHCRGIKLLSFVWTFSLGMGIPVLATESTRGLPAVRRACSLIAIVWWPRFVGAVLIFVPIFGAWTLVSLAVHKFGATGGYDLVSSLLGLALVPAWLLQRIFDVCLYRSLIAGSPGSPVMPGDGRLVRRSSRAMASVTDDLGQ